MKKTRSKKSRDTVPLKETLLQSRNSLKKLKISKVKTLEVLKVSE
jgi:hypothetical protein